MSRSHLTYRACTLVFALVSVPACEDGGTSSSGGGGAASSGGQGGAGATTTTGTGGSTGGSTTTTGTGGSAITCPGLDPLNEPAETLHVAPNGDDSADGTEGAPLASLGEAASRFPGGGTIIVHGGTYGSQHFDATGAPDHPLVIRPASGEHAVFDGADVVGEYDSVIALYTAENVVLQGLEVANCVAPECDGIAASPVNNLSIRLCHIHDVQGSGARFTGKGIRLEANHIHDVALTNVDNAAFPDGGWPTCMGTTPNRDAPDTPQARDVIIRNNAIHDCWGEGIGIWFGDNVVVEGNQIQNSFNVGIYMDNATNITVNRNFVQLDRGMKGGHGSGILMGSEPYDQWGLTSYPSQGVTIMNNIVVAGGGVGWWSSSLSGDANRYEGVHVLNNTIIGTASGAVSFDPVESAPAPSDCELVNNILAEAQDADLGDVGAWTITSNAWLNNAPPIAGDSDVTLGEPVPDVMSPMDALPLAFVAGTGAPAPAVLVDYACHTRDKAALTRGAYEPINDKP